MIRPGQFTVRTLLVLTVQFGLVLALARFAPVPPWAAVVIVAYFVLIVLGRMLLLGQRGAFEGYGLTSMAVGGLTVLLLAPLVVFRNFDPQSLIPVLVLAIVVGLPLGMIFGTVVGVVVALTGLILESIFCLFGGPPVLESLVGLDAEEEPDPYEPPEHDPHQFF